MSLKEEMKCLYATGEYYVKRNREDRHVYEEDYHFVAVDPDGKERSLLGEREHALNGFKDITDFIATLKPGKVLDVGCGLGWILSSIDDRWEKYGVEVSKFASEHAQEYGTIFNGVLENFQVDENTFDVVVMNHVIEHLDCPEDTIKLVKRILKDKGYFIVATPDFDSGAARRFDENFRLLHDKTHISLFSNDSLQRFLRDNDFKIVNVEYPFFDTPWFTKESLMRMFDDDLVSPPFYGSVMAVFAINS